MFQKTLSTAAAALAIAGAVAFTPNQAQAANSLTIGGDWGYVQIGGGYPYGKYSYNGYGGYPYGKYGYGGGYGYKGKYKGGYGYKAGYGDYPVCHTKWKRKKVRYWNDYNNCWEYKVVRRPYRVCY
ncbi:MAG: hypothetical protein ACR2PO_11100 [Methyloligellaceae bacterium]